MGADTETPNTHTLAHSHTYTHMHVHSPHTHMCRQGMYILPFLACFFNKEFKENLHPSVRMSCVWFPIGSPRNLQRAAKDLQVVLVKPWRIPGDYLRSLEIPWRSQVDYQ